MLVTVQYSGSPQPSRGQWGEVGWEELTDGVIVAGQPDGAPSWFPCNDRPNDKASYRLTVSAESAYLVVANGRLVDKQVGGSRTTWVYDQPQPMSTYLATVQIGRYVEWSAHGSAVPVTIVAPPSRRRVAEHDLGRQAQMLEVFQQLFGPYPFAGYTAVVTDDDLEIPLEAQGLSIFGANHVDGQSGSERLVAHELAHQWFGNSLTVDRWQDIWLHEGFACYAEWLWAERADGRPAAAAAREAWERLAALPQDLVLGDPGPDLMFDDRLYKRGALLLHALRVTVGDDCFFDAAAWLDGSTPARVGQHGDVPGARGRTRRRAGGRGARRLARRAGSASLAELAARSQSSAWRTWTRAGCSASSARQAAYPGPTSRSVSCATDGDRSSGHANSRGRSNGGLTTTRRGSRASPSPVAFSTDSLRTQTRARPAAASAGPTCASQRPLPRVERHVVEAGKGGASHRLHVDAHRSGREAATSTRSPAWARLRCTGGQPSGVTATGRPCGPPHRAQVKVSATAAGSSDQHPATTRRSKACPATKRSRSSELPSEASLACSRSVSIPVRRADRCGRPHTTSTTPMATPVMMPWGHGEPRRDVRAPATHPSGVSPGPTFRQRMGGLDESDPPDR